MSRAQAGYKGELYINNVKIGGTVNWNWTGAVRETVDDSALNQEIKTYTPLQIEGGEVTLSGNYLGDEDAGQQLLKSLFDAATEVTNLKLYTNKTRDKYFLPDSTTQPASFVTVTKHSEIALDKSGLITFSATLKVSGVLKEVSTSANPGVDTVGAIDVADVTATLIGDLVGLGDEATVDCYFEYGTTTSLGSSTVGSATTLTAVGLFDNDLTDLSDETTYYFRAVAVLTDTSKVYGPIKSFTTLTN